MLAYDAAGSEVAAVVVALGQGSDHNAGRSVPGVDELAITDVNAYMAYDSFFSTTEAQTAMEGE